MVRLVAVLILALLTACGGREYVVNADAGCNEDDDDDEGDGETGDDDDDDDDDDDCDARGEADEFERRARAEAIDRRENRQVRVIGSLPETHTDEPRERGLGEEDEKTP